MDASVTNLIREIAEAAKAQGVPFEHERNGRKHRVFRLGKTVTVIIPNSIVKPLVRLDILRQCAPELGPRWWENTNGKKTTMRNTTEDLVPEEWRPVHDLEGLWEISNAGRYRKAGSKRVEAPRGNPEAPLAKMTDRKGRIHSRNIVHMVRTTFGHKPLKNVQLDNDPARARRERQKMRELRNPIAHQIPDEKIEELKARVEEPEEQGDDMTTTHPVTEPVSKQDTDPDGAPVETDWRRIELPGVRPIYQISEHAEVLGPKGPLQPTDHPQYQKLTVNLRRSADSPYTGAYTPRLDMLMCTVFHGPRPGEAYGPKHLDGDYHNCAASNLEWAKGYAPQESPKPPRRKAEPEDRPSQLVEAIEDAYDAYEAEQAATDAECSMGIVEAEIPDTPAPRNEAWEVTKEVTTIYRCRGVEVIVHPNGQRDIPPLGQGSSEQFMALAKIVEQIEVDAH